MVLLLKVYCIAYLALFRPPDLEKKTNKNKAQMWQCSSLENYTSGRSTELKLCRLIGGESGKLINLGFPQCKTIIMPLIFQSPVPLFLCLLFSALPSLYMLSDVLSAPRFRVDVFSLVVHAEFEVGVLAPEEFRWKIFLGEDLEPYVVFVCHLHGKLFVIHRW